MTGQAFHNYVFAKDTWREYLEKEKGEERERERERERKREREKLLGQSKDKRKEER